MEESFKWFISGFVAGEGYFHIRKGRNNPRYKLNYHIGAEFGIKLGADDKKILEKIKECLGCGHTMFENNQGKDAYRFRVTKIKDLIEKIIPFFDKYNFFSAKKQQTYNKWKVVVNMILEKEHLNKNGLETILYLSKRINENGKSHGNGRGD